MTVVEVQDLCRVYSSNKKGEVVRALDGISFEVKRGEVFGLLGPNGAGKTTTIKILTTLLAPTSGKSQVLGYDTFGQEQKIRPHINFIFGGELGVYRRLTGRENLIYFANLYKLDRHTRIHRINDLLKLVGLSDKADYKVETYSKGMVQRLQIARCLINDPTVLFLDEPTIGLDPIGARELRDIIRKLSLQGKTVILTTHYMFEADELCGRIAIINNGKIVALDTPEELKTQSGLGKVIEIEVSNIGPEAIEAIRTVKGVEVVAVKKNGLNQVILIHCNRHDVIFPEILQMLGHFDVFSFSERDTTLEDAYIKLIGGNI